MLHGDKVEPGEDALVQFFLSEPVAASWNQPYVVRAESPVETIAGGRILVPNAMKLKRPSSDVLEQIRQLQSKDELVRASAAVYFAGAAHVGASELSRTAAVRHPASVYEELIRLGEVVEIAGAGQRKIRLHQRLLTEYASRIVSNLTKMHDDNSLATVFDRAVVSNQFEYLGAPTIFDAVVRQLEKSGQVRQTSKGIGLADRAPKLSKKERQVLVQIIDQYRKAGFQPPTVRECQDSVLRNQQSVPQLVSLAASDGDLVEINSEYYLHVEAEATLKSKLRVAFAEKQQGLTLSEIREMLETTRKYAVPICEYLDKTGFTIRDGDLRKLKE